VKPPSRWVGGNAVQLLENGEEYFPAVFEAIASAREEVRLETFILFEDEIGQQLHAALVKAAQRGVRVDLLVDGYGTCDLTPEFVDGLTRVGVKLRVYDPARRIWGARFNVLRRMHRKIVVIDGRQAFVGGMNFSQDHMRAFGPLGKQDYAVQVRGPIVAHIHRFLRAQTDPSQSGRRSAARATAADAASKETQGSAEMIFVTRDNHRHRNDIERHYRVAIRAARERVVLANAYFFPGYLLIRQLRRAARRGVHVALILQGEPDMPIVKTAASLLYGYLQSAGVHIHEYRERPLHGKVAVIDGRWATVGSSNLDPLSLVFNLEANLVIRDSAFAQHLDQQLEHLITRQCKAIEPEPAQPAWALWRPMRAFLLYHLLSGYSRWFGWLPHRAPTIHLAGARQREGAAALNATTDGAS